MLNHHPRFKLFIKPRAGAACTSFLINFSLDSVVISLLSSPPSTRSNQSHVCLWSGNYPSQSEGMFGRLREEWLLKTTQHTEDKGVYRQKESGVWVVKQLFDTRERLGKEKQNSWTGQVFQMARVNEFAYMHWALCAWVSRTWAYPHTFCCWSVQCVWVYSPVSRIYF